MNEEGHRKLQGLFLSPERGSGGHSLAHSLMSVLVLIYGSCVSMFPYVRPSSFT